MKCNTKEGQSHSFLAQPRSKTIRLSLLRFTSYKHIVLHNQVKSAMMNINNNQANPADNSAKQDQVVQQVFHTNGTVYLDQFHNKTDTNDNNLEIFLEAASRHKDLQEPQSVAHNNDNIFDFFFLNQETESLSPASNSKESHKEETVKENINLDSGSKMNQKSNSSKVTNDSPIAKIASVIAPQPTYTNPGVNSTDVVEDHPIPRTAYVIPPNLKKPFRIPYARTPIITLLTKQTLPNTVPGYQTMETTNRKPSLQVPQPNLTFLNSEKNNTATVAMAPKATNHGTQNNQSGNNQFDLKDTNILPTDSNSSTNPNLNNFK
jgi:hypothetical protein